MFYKRFLEIMKTYFFTLNWKSWVRFFYGWNNLWNPGVEGVEGFYVTATGFNELSACSEQGGSSAFRQFRRSSHQRCSIKKNCFLKLRNICRKGMCTAFNMRKILTKASNFFQTSLLSQKVFWQKWSNVMIKNLLATLI